ncbi:hypothetical protein [Teichococcus vastitatis]|jgi:hypothetical protein|uniref:Uncharacterized protein n=1 Tax=Teichococcus vastitatis TaxID=2307076 RepID=A0ABS9W4T2_9PROT|nr:hypothetical protein [Pseudoroseomonas vastitatis]MCI0754308.1 hypothetical protein [Pseudoroseomonas vastitatis]
MSKKSAAARKPARVNLPKQALTRIAEVVGRGGSPDRVAREVQAIATAWRADAELDQGEVNEHLAECCESLAEGVEAARTQMEDGDSSDKAAAAQGARSLAALEAAYRAMSEASRG